MAATLVQEATAHEENSSTNGVTITLPSSPTAGNLLVLCHGLYFQPSGGGIQSVSSGFFHRIASGDTAWYVSMNILDKVATGGEGTSIVVTHTSSHGASNTGWIGEFSGMTASPFISGSTGENTDSASNVTSRTSGSSDTDTVNAALIIAAFGMTMNEGPYSSEAFTNSFTLRDSHYGTSGTADHGIVVATREVSSSGTYDTTFSWTPATECNACIAAYQVTSVTVLQITVADAIVITDTGVGNFPVLHITATQGVTVGEMALPSVGSGNNKNTMLISGDQADINGTLDTVLYTSNSGYTGPDTLTVISTNATNNVDTDTVAMTVVAATAAATFDVETLADAPPYRRHFSATKKETP
jgi:hypothetical protein